jgi:hypothetical protein
VSRRCAFAAATFLLTACGAADTGGPNTGDETARAEPVAGREDDGTVTGAENAGEAPLDLPYGSKFTVANSLDTQRFVVPDNTRVSVHVLATARWNAPSRCQGRKFVISLEKEPGRQDLPDGREPGDRVVAERSRGCLPLQSQSGAPRREDLLPLGDHRDHVLVVVALGGIAHVASAAEPTQVAVSSMS